MGAGDTVVGASKLAGTGVPPGLRNTWTPLTGPKQVVPENGTRRVYPLSSSVPVPLSDTAQVGAPGCAALPVAEIVTAVPLISPVALPLSVMLVPQSAVNVPANVVAV